MLMCSTQCEHVYAVPLAGILVFAGFFLDEVPARAAADIVHTDPDAAAPLKALLPCLLCTTAVDGAVPCLSMPCACLLLTLCLLQHEMNSPAKTGVGTPVYMAPEVILGDNKYDAKVSC